MKIIDVIHGYQPYPAKDPPKWVLRNLKKVFVPTAKAMQQGIIRRNVQLQGWTIDNWLSSHQMIHDDAARVLGDLREAKENGHIDLGFSAYSHPILPFLSDALVYSSLKADYLTIFQNIGKPSFIWFPEAAVDPRVLSIATHGFLDKRILVPRMCVSEQGEFGLRVLAYGRKATVHSFNPMLKDVLMGAAYFEKKREYAPKALSWKNARTSMRDPKSLLQTINAIEGKREEYLIVRDWENGESQDSLIKENNYKDISAFLFASKSGSAQFCTLSEFDLGTSGSRSEKYKEIGIKSIKAGSWEPLATEGNPYPYWKPIYHKNSHVLEAVNIWHRFIKYFDLIYQKSLVSLYGEQSLSSLPEMKKNVDRMLKNESFFTSFKNFSPALISCVPWHLTQNPNWDSTPQMPIYFANHILLPSADALCGFYDETVGQETKLVWDNLNGLIKEFVNEVNLIGTNKKNKI